jgi:hypothetical protein
MHGGKLLKHNVIIFFKSLFLKNVCLSVCVLYLGFKIDCHLSAMVHWQSPAGFLNQLTFFPHLMLIIVGQSGNMLKLIHQQIGFSHFNTLLLLFHKEILYLHVHKYLLN